MTNISKISKNQKTKKNKKNNLKGAKRGGGRRKIGTRKRAFHVPSQEPDNNFPRLHRLLRQKSDLTELFKRKQEMPMERTFTYPFLHTKSNSNSFRNIRINTNNFRRLSKKRKTVAVTAEAGPEHQVSNLSNKKHESSKPEFLGNGTFGCGYSPALKCEEECTVPECMESPPKISKLMDQLDANREMERYRVINLSAIPNWKNYFIGSPYLCTTKRDSDISKCELFETVENTKLIIYEDGGPDLINLINSSKIPSLIDILLGLKNIFEGVFLLNSYGIYHLDIKVDNIVTGYLHPHNHYRLIDFGGSLRSEEHLYLNELKLDNIIGFESTNNDNGNGFLPEGKMYTGYLPTIFRVWPFYQFFLSKFLYADTEEESEKITKENYDVLIGVFIERFISVRNTDHIVKKIIDFYIEKGILNNENIGEHSFNISVGDPKILKDIADRIFYNYFDKDLKFKRGYLTLDERKIKRQEIYDIMIKTFDIYSLGLALLLLSHSNKDEGLKNSVRQFIFDNRLLHPDPFQHTISTEQIKNNFITFVDGLKTNSTHV
jgi:hypothetical protein